MRTRGPAGRTTLGWSLAVALLATSCSGGTDPADADAVAAPPVASAVELTRDAELLSADTALDQLCRDHFADVEVDGDLLVGLMTDSGSINDGTFNQFAYEGMQAAARCFGFDTTYVASGAAADGVGQLESLLEQDLEAVVTVGFPLTEATATVAPGHPDVAFIGLDQVVDTHPANLATVTYRDDQAGFLAGAMAGMLSESGTVGVVAGPEDVAPVVALADGFEAGVRHVAPELDVLRVHIPSFSDMDEGAAKARSFVHAGADVVYAPAGFTGSAAILAAAQANRWVIGVDQDQYLTTFEGGRVGGADRIATSTVKRVDLGVFLLLADVARGAFEGGPVVLDAATGGITYAPPHAAPVPDDVLDRLEAIRAGLADGTIDPAAAS